MPVDGKGSFVMDFSGKAVFKSFWALIAVYYQCYHFGGSAVNRITEVICIADSFRGLCLSCDISELGSGCCQIGARRKKYVCACMHMCIYAHQCEHTAEVMFAQRKHSIRVQDWQLVAILLNHGGVGNNLLPEAKCQWLFFFRVRVRNFTLRKCSWSGANRAREWAGNQMCEWPKVQCLHSLLDLLLLDVAM